MEYSEKALVDEYVCKNSRPCLEKQLSFAISKVKKLATFYRGRQRGGGVPRFNILGEQPPEITT